MGIFASIRSWFMNLFRQQAVDKFNVDIIKSDLMEMAQDEWKSIIAGRPYWQDDNIRSINFAKFLCQYVAKKTCLDIKITVAGSPRADYINSVIAQMVAGNTLRDKIEDACGLGGIILKPNGTYNPSNAIDYILPGYFAVTDTNSNGDILGAVFIDQRQKGDVSYTRLEYHHFASIPDPEMGALYIVEQKAYKSNSRDSLGTEILLETVPEWSTIQPVTTFANVTKPLFAYYKTPYNNTIDYASPEGVSIFSNCIKELKDLDVAWSMKANEVEDSQHMTFMNASRFKLPADPEHPHGSMIKLPRQVKGLGAGVDTDVISEHVATLLTEQRIADINSILSMISTKAGFSQGQFILDRKTGMITATQVESDDNETVETITDMRTSLKSAVKDLIYALDKYCDTAYNMPVGVVNALDDTTPDEDIFYFKDLMSTFEQDRTRAYQLMQSGVYSKRQYLTEYEGFTDKDIDAMFAEIAAEKAADTPEPLYPEE